MDLIGVLPELIMGVILGAFAWAFRAWASTIGRSSDRILERLSKISAELHTHRLNNESRMMKVETDLKHLFKRLDQCDIKRHNNNNS